MEASSSSRPTKVVGRRVVAFVVDLVLNAAVNFAIFFALATKDTEIVDQLSEGEIGPNTTLYGNFTFGDTSYSVYGGKAGLYFLLIFLIWFGYWIVLQGTKGITIGKAMMGLRLIKEDGTLPAGIPRTLARQLLWIVDAFPYLIPYLTGFIVAMTSDRNQRVGDKVAGTLVVKADAVGTAAAPPAEPGTTPGQAAWMTPPPS